MTRRPNSRQGCPAVWYDACALRHMPGLCVVAGCLVHQRQLIYLIRCVGLLRLRPPRARTLLTQPLPLAPHLEVAGTQGACEDAATSRVWSAILQRTCHQESWC